MTLVLASKLVKRCAVILPYKLTMNPYFKATRKLNGRAASRDGDWLVELTANDGDVSFTKHPNYDISFSLIKIIMTTDAHMIIIKKDGVDFQRWDRERFLDLNDWNETHDLGTVKESGFIIQYIPIAYVESTTIH